MNQREHEHLGNLLDNAGNVARCGGRSKSDTAPKIHDGMSRQARDMAGIGGLAHGVSVHETPDASSANPLDKEAPPKNLSQVPNTPGMHARTLASATPGFGRVVLSQALKN
jgi:hypothetical protein